MPKAPYLTSPGELWGVYKRKRTLNAEMSGKHSEHADHFKEGLPDAYEELYHRFNSALDSSLSLF